MRVPTKQILLRQPTYSLQLSKTWDEKDAPRHAFILYPTGCQSEGEGGITLLMGEGHEISRRDIHYALYLFQRFHLKNAPVAEAKQG